MNEKEITRLSAARAIRGMFDNVGDDDDKALFVMETMGEFPDDQVVQAIDVAGAVPNPFFWGFSMTEFTQFMQDRMEHEAENVKLNLLVNF